VEECAAQVGEQDALRGHVFFCRLGNLDILIMSFGRAGKNWQ